MRLAIDTATHHALLAVGDDADVLAAVVRPVVPGRGSPLLSLIEEALSAAGASMDDVEAIGVGTGPGSFTGLRAGLATAKTLAWLRRLPLVGLPTDETIRRAAALADPTLGALVAVVLPAGARDHYLALPGADPVLVPPTTDLGSLIGRTPVAALDLARGAPVGAQVSAMLERHPDPSALGAAAIAHAPTALLRVMDERMSSGPPDDPASLVPRYVALPRGIASLPADSGTTVTDTTRGDEAWSPTHP